MLPLPPAERIHLLDHHTNRQRTELQRCVARPAYQPPPANGNKRHDAAEERQWKGSERSRKGSGRPPPADGNNPDNSPAVPPRFSAADCRRLQRAAGRVSCSPGVLGLVGEWADSASSGGGAVGPSDRRLVQVRYNPD